MRPSISIRHFLAVRGGEEVRMSGWFEELDYRKTLMGELILQRRRIAALDNAEAY